jgi:hypothetical protein
MCFGFHMAIMISLKFSGTSIADQSIHNGTAHGFVILYSGFLRFLSFVLIPLDSIWYISRANAIGSTSTKFATHQYPRYTPINMTDISDDPSGQITLDVVNSYFLGS